MNDKLLKILNELNITFTEEEFNKLKNEDICEKERNIEDYIILKNLLDVFDKKGNAKYLLKRNLSEKTAENLLNVYNKNV